MTGCSAINCSNCHTKEYVTRERERGGGRVGKREREKRERERGTSFENREIIRNVLFCVCVCAGGGGVLYITLLNIEVS